MKTLLQNITLFLALYLVLGWMGAKLEWYHGLVIGVAFGIYGAIEVHRDRKRRAFLTADEFDKWIREQVNK